jgi:hypothetical protein
MIRLTWRVLLFVGLLAVALVPDESSAQSGKKRGGPTVDMGGFKSQAFDYWKSEKADKTVLNRFSMTDPKDKSSAELLVKELSGSESADDAFAEVKKHSKPQGDDKLDDVISTSEVKKADPKITQMVIRRANFTPEGPKAKELKDVRIVAAVVETKDKKFLVRLVGPRILIATVQPDLEKFLQDLKK